jgi:hypothetical protein
MPYDYASGNVPQEVRQLAKIIADWSAPAPDFKFYLFGSRVRGDHRPDSDVDLHFKLPPMPTHESTKWWTDQNTANWNSLRAALAWPLCWLEQFAAEMREQVEQGKIVHQDRNVLCVWLPPKLVAIT